MDAFVTTSRQVPSAVFQSTEIKDRKSVFIGSIYKATSQKEVKTAVRYHRDVVHLLNKASHEISAWRIMDVRSGKDGLVGPDDFEVANGSDDDGEKYGGSKILKVMQRHAVLDAVVIVSRWYGGTMLGPARFTHIEQCAIEVCKQFKSLEQIDNHIIQLTQLDETLAELRSKVNTSTSDSPVKIPNYDDLRSGLDVIKAQRLLVARQKAIDSVKKIQMSKET